MYCLSLAAQLEVEAAEDHRKGHKWGHGVGGLQVELMRVYLAAHQDVVVGVFLPYQHHVLNRGQFALPLEIDAVAVMLLIVPGFLGHQLDDLPVGIVSTAVVQFLEGGVAVT